MTLRKFKNISNYIIFPVGLAALAVAFLTGNSDDAVFKISMIVFLYVVIIGRYFRSKYCYCQICNGYIGNKFNNHCKYCGCRLDLDKEITP